MKQGCPPPQTIADELMAKLGVLAFYRYMGKVQLFLACWYDTQLSHEENWRVAMAAIESGWTPEKELNGKEHHPGDSAVSVSAARPNLAGLAAQLQRRWRLGT
jgi:hypothetical protein